MNQESRQRLDDPPQGRGTNYLHFVLDQLADLENISFKKMYGGIAFFLDGLMFGAITGGKFRLKAASTCSGKPGMGELSVPNIDTEEEVGKYFEVPGEVLRDKGRLKKWVEKAHREALRAAS